MVAVDACSPASGPLGALTVHPAWAKDHAVESRLFPERYVEIVSAAVLAALDNPIGKQ